MKGTSLKSMVATSVLAFTIFAAAAPSATAKDGDWGFDIGIYGWLPTIDGKLTHDVPGVGDQVEIDPGTLLENLSFTAMGAFSVNRGRWSLGADLIYLKETKAESQPVEELGGLVLNADYKLNSWIVNGALGYRVVESPKFQLRAMLGVRYFYAESTLRLQVDAPPVDETLRSAPTVWNGFVGGRGRVELGKHWYLPFYLDIGTGGSDFTWQGYAGIGYAFKWGGPVLGYRYLSFDQGDEEAVRRLSFGGPELGVGFRF
jgi:hypothetical protein